MPTLEQLLPLLEADPNDAFAHYAVAMEFAKQSRFDESMAQFTELLRRHPDYVPGYFMAGRTARQKGEVESARALLKSGIAAAQRTGDRHAIDEMTEALEMME